MGSLIHYLALVPIGLFLLLILANPAGWLLFGIVAAVWLLVVYGGYGAWVLKKNREFGARSRSDVRDLKGDVRDRLGGRKK